MSASDDKREESPWLEVMLAKMREMREWQERNEQFLQAAIEDEKAREAVAPDASKP
jgi:hypothetical protein